MCATFRSLFLAPPVCPTLDGGEKERDTFPALLNKAYEETVHWRRNTFELPRGKIGSALVREVSRMIEAYNDAWL